MQSTAYWLHDQPVDPLVLVPTRDGAPIDLEPFVGASAVLVGPAGQTDAPTVTIATDDDGLSLHVELPALEHAGLNWLRVTLAAAEGRQQRIDAVPVIVQDDDGWHTLASARAEWPDAAGIDDRRLFVLLTIARDEVLTYAPRLPAGTLVPLPYREGQLLQARNRLNAARVGPSGSTGADDGFQLSPFPLDWTVKQLLRPQSGLRYIR